MCSVNIPFVFTAFWIRAFIYEVLKTETATNETLGCNAYI